MFFIIFARLLFVVVVASVFRSSAPSRRVLIITRAIIYTIRPAYRSPAKRLSTPSAVFILSVFTFVRRRRLRHWSSRGRRRIIRSSRKYRAYRNVERVDPTTAAFFIGRSRRSLCSSRARAVRRDSVANCGENGPWTEYIPERVSRY